MKLMQSKIQFRIHSIRRAVVASLAIAAAAPLCADVLFLDNFENPNVPSYAQGITPDAWVRATTGFGSGDHGMTDKSGGNFAAPPGNEQAYAFRYTNSGITSAAQALGPPLIFGGGYEVSFDVVKDNSNGGRAYGVNLIAFGAGAARNDCRSTPAGSTVLASTSGNAPADGSFTTVTFTFIPNATTHAVEFGKDLGIRVIGSSSNAIIDNIKFRAIPGTSPGLNLVTTAPVDNSVNNLATNPLKAIFNKNITAGTGSITLRNLTDTIDTVIPASDPRIVIAGVCMDIVPGAPLTWGKNYAVLIDSDAIVETPGGTPFAGFMDETTWNFTTAGGDPLLYSISQLKDHINGIITLSAAEINTIKLNLDSVVGRFAESSTTISALLDLITTYDTASNVDRKGPLWVFRSLPKRNVVTNDLHWTIFNVMQNIMDRIYTGPTLAAHEVLLDGFKFDSSANFPGVCAPPVPNTHTATISASYLDTYGPATLADGPGTYARKPTGTYLAPGTIATITVPESMRGTGYKIRVGANSPDFSAKPDIKRLDRVTRVYDITSEHTKVASPLGGGIYIEVPFLANAGVVTVDISGAVRSPYFSAKSFHTTTAAEWLTESAHPAPWADFQSDKFIMQVPKSWIFNMTGVQATQLMADWDSAMDAMNDLMGYPHIRGKETMYPQVDLLLKNSVYAPGYPSINTTYSPTGSYGGYANSHLVRGPQNAPDYEFHEQGHAYTFPKFGGETESAVNLHHVAVWNQKFGKTMDEAFRKSRGSGNTFQTLDTTAVAWMCVFNFSPREVPMADGEKAYQLKGHAKFVDIAQMYGWGVLGDFWGSMVDLEETNTAYATDNDAMMLRLCKAVGKDVRPLLHFWGIYPQNPATLASAVAAEGLLPDLLIRDRLLYYKTLVPANNTAFRAFATNWWGKQPSINGYWEEREHARQWDTTALYGPGDQQRSELTNPGEIYNENSASDITNRVQELVDLYFPLGISPSTITFAIAPTAVNATTIGMTAITATATFGPVQYYFENITNSTNSGWIATPAWNSTGLVTGNNYAFRVKARDGQVIPNETTWSASFSVIAGPDSTPPAPTPMTFATPPFTLSETSISMTASTATDINDVEYFFDCTSGGGNDSGWQDSPSYIDTALPTNVTFTYQVQARDKSSVQNATAFSVGASATTTDVTPPTLVSLNPANDSPGVPSDSDLTLIFSEDIAAGSGFITLKNLTDATQSQINISDAAQVSISGAILTIDPTSALSEGKSYAIRVDATAIDDLLGNSYVGITNDTTWTFSTLDPTPPSIANLIPADNATNASVNTNLVLTFNETITLGSGSVTIKNLTDATAEVITLPDSQVTVAGSVLTINPTANLLAAKNYAIWIGANAIKDLADNAFPGIADDTTWNFTTAAFPFVWTQTAGNAQDWDTGANWLGGSSPSPVAGDTVDFSTVNIAADTTLTLSEDRTAQLWKFGDTSGAQKWIINAGNQMILAGTTPTIQVNNNTTTLNNIVAGTAGLTKTGAGTLTLTNAANSFSGDVVINGGLMDGATAATLGTGTNITFSGNSTLQPAYGAYPVFAKGITINPGVTATLNVPNQFYRMTFTAPVVGNGILAATCSDNGKGSITLSSAANLFTGTILLGSATRGCTLTLNSLADSANPIRIYRDTAGDSAATPLALGAGTAAPLLFNSRRIELLGTTTGATINNDNATATNTITINTELLVTGVGNKTLTLGGGNTGANTFGGVIANATGSVISLAKTGSGQWLLSGAGNTFTGAITLNTTTTSAGTLAYASAAGVNPINFLQTTGTATLSYTGAAPLTMSGAITAAALTTGTITLEASGVTPADAINYSNATSLTAVSNNTGARKIVLAGSNTGDNIFNGAITNNSGVAGTATLTKNGVGTWILSGANTYTGATAVNTGTLAVTGSLGATAVTVTSPATLGGNGNIGGNVSIGSGAHHALAVAATAGAQVTRAITGTLTLTSGNILDLSAASPPMGGIYVLATATTAITGTPTIINYNGIDGTVSVDTVSSPKRLLLTVAGGPGPVDHFVISAIASPQTVGTPITGITITAQDLSNQTATGFTGTVTFAGTGGFTGTSASFVAGVLSGVSVTPTVAGSNLTLTVNDGASHSGSATITTIQTPYTAWAGAAAFDDDANSDGVKNGLAWLLGAANPNANAVGLLPVATHDSGKLILTFKCLNAAKRGGAILNLQYSKDLGLADLWSSHVAAVPETSSTVNSVVFVTSAFDANLNSIQATIPASAAAPGTSLFGRVEANP